jgi:hypothetical protein
VAAGAAGGVAAGVIICAIQAMASAGGAGVWAAPAPPAASPVAVLPAALELVELSGLVEPPELLELVELAVLRPSAVAITLPKSELPAAGVVCAALAPPAVAVAEGAEGAEVERLRGRAAAWAWPD